MIDVRELLPLYALGILDPDEAHAVERAVAADPALAAELVSYQQAALQLVAPVAPPPDVKARLLVSIGHGTWERFLTRFGKVFDVTLDRARELMALTERMASWEAPMPGVRLVHFSGGAACAAADCGFVRLAPGASFPWHAHKGEELSLVLSGKLRDHNGQVLAAGDEMTLAEGTEHDVTAEGDEECVFAARVMNGIELRPHP